MEIINFQRMISSRESYDFRKTKTIPEITDSCFNLEKGLQGSLRHDKATQELLPELPDKTITFKDTKPLPTAEQFLDPAARDLEHQSMVILNDEGKVKGCIADNGVISMYDWTVIDLQRQADGNIAKFTELLEENGYTVETYSTGKGPTYAEVLKQLHIDDFGMDYSS